MKDKNENQDADTAIAERPLDVIVVDGKQYEIVVKGTATEDSNDYISDEETVFVFDDEYNTATAHDTEDYETYGSVKKGDMILTLRPVDPMRGLKVIQKVSAGESFVMSKIQAGDYLIHARKED